MAINPVGTSVAFGAQTQEKKKTSPILPAIAGAAIGGGASYFTNLGKSPEFGPDDADKFVSSNDAKKNLGEIKDKDADVKTLTDEIESQTKTKEANGKVIDSLFTGDKNEIEAKHVLDKAGVTFEDVQASLADKAEDPIKAQETEVAAIKKEAESVEKGKSKEVTIGDKAFQISKDDKDVVTFVGGKFNGEGEKKAFKAEGKPSALTAAEEAASKARKKFAKETNIASALGITKDTKLEGLKANKEAAGKVLDAATATLSDKAVSAFKNIQEALPKVTSKLKVGMYAGGGALLAAIAAMALGGNKE